jgi:hypothetical protein
MEPIILEEEGDLQDLEALDDQKEYNPNEIAESIRNIKRRFNVSERVISELAEKLMKEIILFRRKERCC